MATKRRMGAAGATVLQPRKGWREAVAGDAAAAAKTSSSRAAGPLVPAMWMVEGRHRKALQEAAQKLRDQSGGKGRADASRVLRALLDAWIEAGGELPAQALEHE
jgi:hypothetical protein